MGSKQDADPPARVVHGRVKWFDQVKGFGFVVSDNVGSDILLHANVLRNFGQNSIADGAKVEIVVNETARGMQAAEVLNIEVESQAEDAGGRSTRPGQEDAPGTSELRAARVKWFDKSKGFGFANVFGKSEDVFIHIETLRLSGLADLQPGEAVCMRVTMGERGLMAVEVCSWDAAAKGEA
ncbi:MAG: cold shock domain-containing protein [Pseudomonadota bacterium]